MLTYAWFRVYGFVKFELLRYTLRAEGSILYVCQRRGARKPASLAPSQDSTAAPAYHLPPLLPFVRTAQMQAGEQRGTDLQPLTCISDHHSLAANKTYINQSKLA